MEQIIVFTRILNQHFESKECFSAASCKGLCKLLMEAKISVFLVERRLDNYNIDAYSMFATYIVKMEWIISEVLTAVLWESRM